jgi:hypothetical protein
MWFFGYFKISQNIMEDTKIVINPLSSPALTFDKDLYNYIRNIKQDEKKYMLSGLEMIGEGASGTVYTAKVKSEKDLPQIILKEFTRSKYAENEYEALKYIRDEMISNRIPNYFVFLYGSFTSGEYRYLILDKLDLKVSEYLTKYNINTKTIFQIFYQISNAVSFLEKVNFNHGDLWDENVLIKWSPNTMHLPEYERDFTIKIIDFDSSFKSDSTIIHPSYGGASKFRNKFILGYDLNRYFDSILYSYNSFIKKKYKDKLYRIEQAKKNIKKGKKGVIVPDINIEDEEDLAWDAENILYPEEIVNWLQDLKFVDVNNFNPNPKMSGIKILMSIKEASSHLNMTVFDNDKRVPESET